MGLVWCYRQPKNAQPNIRIIIVKKTRILIVFSIIFQMSYAQNKTVDNYLSIDKKALQIPEDQTNSVDLISDYIKVNFKTEKERVRAIFIWIATNINYDIENMYSVDFDNSDSAKISRPLQTRKGVCANYAALFYALCVKLNIRSYIIDGYTKQNGIVDNASHAWCAAFVEGSWFLFDPTWGSGYANNGKYYKKLNNSYFLAKPSDLIRSHMPYDYLWQFMEYPLTNQEFIEGKLGLNKSRSYFNYKDSIEAYEKQDEFTRLVSSAKRIEKNGIKHALIMTKLQYLKQNIENTVHNRFVGIYNSAVVESNDGIDSLNAFINCRNNQFIPKKTDQEIQRMLDVANDKLNNSKSKIAQVKSTDTNLTVLVGQLNRSIDEATNQLKQQQNWLKTYLSKGKLGRKLMFVDKVTWFGIPLN